MLPNVMPTEPPAPAQVADAGDRWWRLTEGGATDGPYTFVELVHLAAVARLAPTDRVWNARFPEWAEAGAVQGLFPGRPEGTAAAPARRFPSDTLPLLVLAGIVLCFGLHFGARRLSAGLDSSHPAQRARAGLPVPAAAGGPLYELEICNRTEADKVYVAVAYYDAARADWVARGWFPQKDGECRITMKNLVPPVYVYGETRDGSAKWGDTDPGAEFCIEGNGPFVLGQKGCRGPAAEGRRVQHFKELTLPPDGGRHTWELTE